MFPVDHLCLAVPSTTDWAEMQEMVISTRDVLSQDHLLSMKTTSSSITRVQMRCVLGRLFKVNTNSCRPLETKAGLRYAQIYKAGKSGYERMACSPGN